MYHNCSYKYGQGCFFILPQSTFSSYGTDIPPYLYRSYDGTAGVITVPGARQLCFNSSTNYCFTELLFGPRQNNYNKRIYLRNNLTPHYVNNSIESVRSFRIIS